MPKQTDKKIFIVLMAVLISTVSLPTAGSAIEYGGVGGRPANPDPNNPRTNSIFIYTINPEGTKNDAITVVNNTPEPKTLEIYAVDSQVSSGGALSCEQQPDKKDEVGSWLKVGQSEVTLPQQSSVDVAFTLAVPKQVSPGEHNGCIVVQQKGQVAKREGNVALSTRTGIRVAVTIPGDIKRELNFAEYNVTRNAKGDYIQQARIKNLGNVSLDADIKTQTSFLGLAGIGDNGGTFPVLPFTIGEFNFDLKKPFWGLFYRSTSSLTYDADPGQGEDKKKLVGPAKWFWVWPQPLAAAIEALVLLLLIAAIVWPIRRRRLTRAMDKWEPYTVKSGESLRDVAKKHRTSPGKVATANDVTRRYRPKTGDTLKVPPKKK